IWGAIRGILWDIPTSVWRSQTVRGFRQSLPVRFFVRHFWSPLLITILLSVLALVFGLSPLALLRPSLKVFWDVPWLIIFWSVLTLAYNTPWGWVVQDHIVEKVSDAWRLLRVNLLPGLIATFIDWFKMLSNWFERQLYAVDEWLHYRRGDSQKSLA